MKVAFLFPGQGSQEVGMGLDAFGAFESARAVFEDANAALGFSISDLCFRGPLEELTLTANTQPALVTTSVALLSAVREVYPALPVPACVAGHSLGEYAALVATGSMRLADAVSLCRMRGIAMQEAVPPGKGAMAAVIGLDDDAVRDVCCAAGEAEVLSPANYNGPSQTVIAGDATAVHRAVALVAKRGGRAILLKVSAPFHCALMVPAADRLAPSIQEVPLSPLAFPIVANIDGLATQDCETSRRNLMNQIVSPVQWVRTVETIAALGVTHAIEFGPGKVLSGLVKRIRKELQVYSVRDRASIEGLLGFLGGS